MKKKSSRNPATKGKAAPKRRAAMSAGPAAAPQSVDEYFDRLSEPTLSALDKIRQAIRSVVPADATEIISYNIPAFKHKKVLVWYAAFTKHCSLFPTAAIIESFKDELKDYSTSKGTIHFPLDKPMPVELIKRMVKARVADSEKQEIS